jgi:hypothetical protein
MKKILLLGFALAVPAMLFLNAWQGFKYHTLADQVSVLEKHQKDLIEQNMGVIARIERERSPQRIEERAAAEPGLTPIDQSRVTRVVVQGGTQGP